MTGISLIASLGLVAAAQMATPSTASAAEFGVEVPSASRPAPGPTQSRSSEGRLAASPPREIGLGTIQLVGGYVAEIGGLFAVFSVGLSPKGLGVGSDVAAMGMVAILAPALAGGAVCGMGLLSRFYRGRCTTTLLGAYSGAALGLVIGIAAASEPGPDSSRNFEQAVGGVIGVLALTPIGAVIGYHAGKEAIASPTPTVEGATDAGARLAPVGGAAGESSRSSVLAFKDPPVQQVMLPILSLNW